MLAGAVVAFWGVSMLFVITPGADWAYAITAGLARRTTPAVLGLLTGHLAATIVVAAGVGSVVANAPAALTALTIAGSLYLVGLGVGTLRRPAVVHTDPSAVAMTSWRWGVKGFGVSGLNPKLLLLFLAILPQFISPTTGLPAGAQITILGLVHVASCAIVYFTVAQAAQMVLGSRAAAARIVSWVSGVLMIGIGFVLLAEQLLH